MLLSTIIAAGLVGSAAAHGSQVKPKPEGMTWANWHMVEEHQLDSYDLDTLFRLHDLSQLGFWLALDILNLYGLLRTSVVGDGSGMGVHEHDQLREAILEDAKRTVVATILELLDVDGDGHVSLAELKAFYRAKGELPDFGYGQGHHLDFESEYEEHHWNKYHALQDPDVLVKHKEDIEHELLHHEHELEQTHGDAPHIRDAARRFRSQVRLANIPPKYRA